ncbi:MAG TPA: DUF1365 domain-containing protein [Candidatus Acidoferrum sp.]|nr:DUF1365 domain-containing protein [Candidatus Acidoferrum sp.]
MESALYVGNLRHRRFSPKKHSFEYPVFLSLLDIDAIPQALRKSRLTGYERWNVLSYFERDHFGDTRKSLRQRLEEDAHRQGLAVPDGKIFLLTHLRYLGYVFNPVSFFYFYDRAGNLQQMMAEVNNTFGESHNYWLTSQNERVSSAARRYTSEKRMHVSPFMGMDLEYDWIFTEPGEKLVAHMNTVQNGKPFFDATLQLARRNWTSAEIRRVVTAYPFMTAKVIGVIHWEALKLWFKRVPVFTHQTKQTGEQRNLEASASAGVTKGNVSG